MKKSFQSTLILLAVFAGLLAWYLIYEKKLRPERTEKEEQAKAIVAMPRDSIQELTVLQRQGDEKSTKYRTIRFKKAGTEWHLTEPVEDVADLGPINGLLTAVTTARHERIVDEKPADLDAFGLKNPKIKILLRKDTSSPVEELWVGSDTPVGNSLYVKLADKAPVFRAGQVLRTSFDKQPNEYRNKKVLNLARPDIVELEIRPTSGGSFVLRKAEGEKWSLARENLPASDGEVSKTLNAVLEMRADGFAADKPSAAELSKYGLSPAAVAITFKKKDGRSQVTLGKAGGKYYAKGEKSVIYEVSKDVFEKASRPAKEYRDLKLAQFNRFDINRIKIEHGPESFELVKDTTGWKVASDPKAKVETAKVEDYLSRLQDVRVKAYLDASQKPKKPGLIIQLFEKKGSAAEALAVTLKLAKGAGQATGERTGLDIAYSLQEVDFKKIDAFKQQFLASEKQVENKAGTGKS